MRISFLGAKSGLVTKTVFVLAISAIYFGLGVEMAQADSVTKAVRMHERIAGVPPTAAVRAQMASLITAGQPTQAALLAIESPYFYNVTLKNMFKPLTNREDQVVTPLNDMVATMIGLIRDDESFDKVLYGDIYYAAADGTANVTNWARNSNQHYVDLESRRVDLSQALVAGSQSQMMQITDSAGVLTSRAYGSSFMTAGTNRAVVRWAFKNFLCNDMEQLSDTTRPDYHVRRDVERNPGGDSKTFKSQCVGCHAGMDGLAGAAAYFDFVNNQVTESTGVVAKINAQSKFANGWVTADNSWVNLWQDGGPNMRLGFMGARTGNGLRSFGQAMSQTAEFPRCMAKRVFRQVCQRDPIMDSSKANAEVVVIQDLANAFKANNYDMKALFAATSARCMGE